MITETLLRALERTHGHLGVLAAAALLHPAILLRRPRRRAPLSVAFATLLASGAAAMGAYIYPIYRTRLKQDIFIHSPSIGWMFERKEHLAVGAVAFAWIGCVLHFTSRSFEAKHHDAVQSMAQRSFAVAFVLSLLVTCIGVLVASVKSF